MAKSEGTDTRWNLRVASVDHDLVRQLASLSDRNLSDFVPVAAKVEDERVLADRSRFILDDAQWAEFQDLLERPPGARPRLAKLFAKQSVFE